jgi:tetratricopeptide (TPR) repeat protein
MADPLRDQDTSAAFPPGRESRIEELLLAGLDHYFSGQHELAISVWTRVLFLDRSHARARAYIERARGAIAERQREGDELLHTGAAAFDRGDTADARRLLTSAVERGAQPDEALAMLERLERLAPADVETMSARVEPRPHRYVRSAGRDTARRGIRAATLVLVLAIGLASGVLMMIAWSSGMLPWSPAASASVSATHTVLEPLPVPTSAEGSLARARSRAGSGQLRDALTALDAIRLGDPLRPQADELRARLQQQLLDSAHASRAQPPPPASPK